VPNSFRNVIVNPVNIEVGPSFLNDCEALKLYRPTKGLSARAMRIALTTVTIPGNMKL
jgi:hypothetical protein